MAAKQPVIKFSPFEALLIGEKNKVLKRQPMKNTIFVTRINQGSKIINLRDLFGLDKDTKNSENKDIIFKIPQRVHEFLRNRKLKSNSGNVIVSNKKDVLQYEFEGEKIIVKNHNAREPRDRIIKLKSNKVKFKKKVKQNSLQKKMLTKLCQQDRKRNHKQNRNKNIIPRIVLRGIKKRRYSTNRHLLRGKDGKFICRSEYEKLKSNEISTKHNCISKYFHQLYLKNNKSLYSNKLSGEENLQPFNTPYSIKNFIGLPKIHQESDLDAYEAKLNEISKKYYESNCPEEFLFPAYPIQIEASDFEDDCILNDIIYSNMPKSLKFESTDLSDDFSDALRNAEILTLDKGLKFYEKKKNGGVKEAEVEVILENHISCIDLEKINNINAPLKNQMNGLISAIDEPYTKKSHLITGRNLASLFFRSAEGKDVFIGNLVKPFLQNSWFGSLPDF